MIRLLVSVQDPAEALLAAHGGADFIDAKEPGQGALGGLPPATIRAIVQALREAGSALPVSATIGDVPMTALPLIRERVDAVAACEVDYVKVGIERDPAAFAVLDMLARCGHAVVPVFIGDRGLDFDLVGHALAQDFAGLMVDTADKQAGSLFDAVPLADLQRFVERGAGRMTGLAGALRQEHAHRLAALRPSFAGFRSAVCAGHRANALDAALLRELAVAMRAAQAPTGRDSPISSERMRGSSVR